MYANDIAVYLGWNDAEIGRLLQKALWHDVEEIFSGDLPGPCKRAAMVDRQSWDNRLRGWLNKIFDRMPERDGSHPARRFRIPEEAFDAVIKLADMIDECCEMGTELQMGNQTVEKVYRDSMERVKAALAKLAEVEPTLGSGPAWTKLHGRVIHACQQSRHGESKSTRIFETL
jgi:5'-deoxynucleotidase YfbR-like HD superfamily hydrolase